jgi:PIN domain nuclease of toxin-antitoxin system
MNVLLDTAAWINSVKEPETLPTKVLTVLRSETNHFYISDISLLEASTLGRPCLPDHSLQVAKRPQRKIG